MFIDKTAMPALVCNMERAWPQDLDQIHQSGLLQDHGAFHASDFSFQVVNSLKESLSRPPLYLSALRILLAQSVGIGASSYKFCNVRGMQLDNIIECPC